MAALRLGLTGGIGSGKSTVAGMLATLGAVILDADAESRRVTAAGGAATGPIAMLFGPQFIDVHGALDRDAMRTRVFEDPSARKQLEEIIHPLVQDAISRLAVQAGTAGARCVVFDIPLLVESGHRWRARVDRVLVVDCDTDTQRQRVVSRSGLLGVETSQIQTGPLSHPPTSYSCAPAVSALKSICPWYALNSRR